MNKVRMIAAALAAVMSTTPVAAESFITYSRNVPEQVVEAEDKIWENVPDWIQEDLDDVCDGIAVSMVDSVPESAKDVGKYPLDPVLDGTMYLDSDSVYVAFNGSDKILRHTAKNLEKGAQEKWVKGYRSEVITIYEIMRDSGIYDPQALIKRYGFRMAMQCPCCVRAYLRAHTKKR